LDNLSDDILIEKFLDGNTEAFNTLVWRWQKQIYSFVYRYIHDSDIAKDICQTVFIRVYKNLKKLRDRKKFKPWLYMIAANISKDELKKNKKKNLRMLSVNDEWKNDKGEKLVYNEVLKEEASQEKEINGKDIENIIKFALSHIPEEQRIVIILKEYQQLKFKEIAEILKLPVNTIKSRMYYGLKNMREVLIKNNFDKEVLLNET